VQQEKDDAFTKEMIPAWTKEIHNRLREEAAETGK
jgi:hypothetical protein